MRNLHTHDIYRASIAAALTALLSACGPPAETSQVSAPPAAAAESAGEGDANAAFDADIERLSRSYLSLAPVEATAMGLPDSLAGPQYHARLPDLSPAGLARKVAVIRDIARTMSAWSPEALSAERAHTRAVLVAQTQASLAAWEAIDGAWAELQIGFVDVYPINQFNSAIGDFFQVMQVQQPLDSADDAVAYLRRLQSFGAAFDGLIEKMNADAAAGVVPPDFIIERCRAIVANMLAPAPGEHSLVTTLAERLRAAGIDAEDHVSEATEMLERVVYPAYRRVDAALAALEPQATHDAGIWRLPNGPALYERLIRLHADSDYSADEIHEIGLAEVARIHAEIDAILSGVGMTEGTVAERLAELSSASEYVVADDAEGRAALIAAANGYVEALAAELDAWFGAVPPQPVEVRRVPEAIEDAQALGYYSPPPLNGSAPGIFWINLRDPALWPVWTVKTTTYHETAPGHHFQVALALEQQTPVIEKVFGIGMTSGAAEGWALYAELLAKEMGLYEGDPLGDVGRLQAELFRAVRLVVDTGLHAKRWTREQAIDYMVTSGATSGYDDAVSEVERYVVWPAQALAYKLGMLKIVELRAAAEAALGEGFDIRAFHDELLLGRSGPLPVVAAGIEAWIAAQEDY